MRLLLILLLIGITLAAPQGYNYNLAPTAPAINRDYPSDAYQLQTLQQFISSQQPDVQFGQQQYQPIGQLSYGSSNGGYQYANQFNQFEAQLPQGLPQQQPIEVQVDQPRPTQQAPLPELPVQPVFAEQPGQGLSSPAQAPASPAVTQFSQLPSQSVSLPSSVTPVPLTLPQLQIEPKRTIGIRPVPTAPPLRYNKEFFYLSAPQEDFEMPASLQRELNQLKRNLRIVFIRTPENNGIEKAALQLAQQNINEQTAIYVLTKQHDANELAGKLKQIRTEGNKKPEVVFIKYKTPAEAEQAQRAIQAQYEALDGPNHFNHEGVALSHSFIGPQLDPRRTNSQGQLTAIKESNPANTPADKYLPAVPVN